MARVRMLTSVADRGFAAGVGEEVDIDDARAEAWCASGQAEWVVTPERRVTERAVNPPRGERRARSSTPGDA